MLSQLRVVNKRSKQKCVEFELCAPAEDATCPITQDLISQSELEFMEGVTFVKGSPELRSMKLQCGHEFSAMCLVYHWARSGNVKCPVCRAGPEGSRLNLLRLPDHFRAPLARRVRSEKRKDDAEQRRSDEDAARRLSASWIHGQAIELLPDMVNLVVSNQSTSTGYRMPCNLMITHEGLLLSCYVRSAMLLEMQPFRIFGMFQSGPVETRFPFTRWMEINEHTRFERDNVGRVGMFMTYTIRIEPGATSLIEWRVQSAYFAFMAEMHAFKLSMSEFSD